MSKFKQWRSNLASSPFAFSLVSATMSGFMRFVFFSSKFEKDGWEEFERALQSEKAIIVCCWHQRILLLPRLMPGHEANCNGVTSNKRPGRMFGRMLTRFGFQTMPMPRGSLGTANMRSLLRGLSKGTSLCVSPDGAKGPARICKPMPIQWARVTQVPIYTFTFSAKRYWKLPSWDHMLVPKPFNRINLIWRKWDVTVPKKLENTKELQLQLQSFLDDICEEADRKMGHEGPIL